jgi:hypothetical protein
VLQKEEEVTWVCGPRPGGFLERWFTHPLLFVVALAGAALCVGIGWLAVGGDSELLMAPVLAALLGVVGSILVLGLASGHFTRLVVTNLRIVVVQGREVCRNWSLDRLPPSLLRYRRRGPDEEEERTVDLESLKTMLAFSSDKVTDSKTILAFAKQLEKLGPRSPRRP